MRESGRAIRRYKRDVKMVKAKELLSKWRSTQNPGKFVDNMAACSCSMCANPRKEYKQLTIQECRAMQKGE